MVRSLLRLVVELLRLPKPLVAYSNTLSIDTKRAMHNAVVVSILLYEAETWTVKAPDVRRLTTFHNRCVHTILGVSKFYQWQNHITSKQLFGQFGVCMLECLCMCVYVCSLFVCSVCV